MGPLLLQRPCPRLPLSTPQPPPPRPHPTCLLPVLDQRARASDRAGGIIPGVPLNDGVSSASERMPGLVAVVAKAD